MWRPLFHGRKRIEIARTIVNDLLTLFVEASQKANIIPRLVIYAFPSKTSLYTPAAYDYIASRLITSGATAKFISKLIESETSEPLATTPFFKTITELLEDITKIRKGLRVIVVSDAESTEPPAEARRLIDKITNLVESVNAKILVILVNTRIPASLAMLTSQKPGRIRIMQVDAGMLYTNIHRIETLRRGLHWLLEVGF